MEEARAVLQRLQRLEALERGGALAGTLLAEVRELVLEAEAWLAIENGAELAEAALEQCRVALADTLVP